MRAIIHQLLLPMRLISRIILLQTIFATALYASEGKAQVKSVRETFLQINLQKTTLRETFNAIEAKTGFTFGFDEKLIDAKQTKITYSKERTSVADLLIHITKKSGLRFKQINHTISILEYEKTQNPKKSIEEIIDQFSVSGKVTDENGVGLPGATVLEKGTSNGTVTDVNGQYSLTVTDENAILIVSFVGYTEEEISIGGRSVIDVGMSPDITALQEIIVVGYGTQQKVNSTGAVSQIEFDDVVSTPVADPTQLMYGRMPGVQLQQNTGEPGSTTTITVRGPNIGNSNPLIVVDGILLDNDAFQELAPSDIASMTVLKDAASAAIYGAQGANGVIVITTKKGKAGKPRITYNASVGSSSPIDLPEVLRGVPYMEAMNEREIVGGAGPLYDDEIIDAVRNGTANPDYFGNDDWMDELFGPALFTDHYISISGGSENTSYLISTRYNRQEGTITGPNALDWYSVRAKIDTDVAPWINLGVNLVGNYRNTEGFRGNGAFSANGDGGLINQVFRMSPQMRIRYPSTGEFAAGYSFDGQGFDETNINPIQRSNNLDARRDQYNLLSQFTAKVKILEGLTFEPSLVFEYNTQFEEQFFPQYQLFDASGDTLIQENALADFSRDAGYNMNTQVTALLRYEKVIADRHDIGLLAGYQVINNDLRNSLFDLSVDGFASNDLRNIEEFNNPDGINIGGNAPVFDRTISYFGRAEYRLDQKYLLEANFRVDGHSRFNSDNRYGFFPAFSAGWRISEESFMSGLNNTITELKLRSSWGQLGSINNLRRAAFIQNYEAGADYIFGGSLADGTSVDDLANENITWETTETTNIGLDIELFGRLALVADWYIRDTEDLIITDNSIPRSNRGDAGLPFINGASVRNQGLELALSYLGDAGDDLRYNVGFNVTYNENEITDLPEANREDGIISGGARGEFINEIGSPIGSFRGFVYEGIYQTQEEIDNGPDPRQGGNTQPGFRRYADISGPEGVPDGVVDNFDRVVIGNPFPEFVYGFNGQVFYKNFDLGFTFNGIAGVDRARPSQGNTTLNLNMLEEWEGRWSPENTGSDLPLLGSDDEFSTWNMVDGSYLRLKLVELGYTLPGSITSRVNIQKLRVYFSGTNLLTWTDFTDGFDPERASGDLRQDVYPLNQTYVFGVNLSF